MRQLNEIGHTGNNSTEMAFQAILDYNGNIITFQKTDNDVMVNLTEMAKAFGKRPNDFLSLPTTNQLISAITRKSGIAENQLVITIRGGLNPCTWAHRLVALSFAQWLSVDFHLLCLEKIEELLRTGVATVSNDDEVIARAIQVLNQRLEAARIEKERLQVQNAIQREQLKLSASKVEYCEQVLQSKSTYTTTQIAKEVGMSAETLNKRLKEKGVQFRQSGQWLLKAEYQDKGYTETRTHAWANKHGETGSSSLTVWTERGREFILNLFRNFQNN